MTLSGDLLNYVIAGLFVLALMKWIIETVDAIKAKKNLWKRVAALVTIAGVSLIFDSTVKGIGIAFMAIFVIVILGHHMILKPFFKLIGGENVTDAQIAKAQAELDKTTGEV